MPSIGFEIATPIQGRFIALNTLAMPLVQTDSRRLRHSHCWLRSLRFRQTPPRKAPVQRLGLGKPCSPALPIRRRKADS
jgi:hypothetical protein